MKTFALIVARERIDAMLDEVARERLIRAARPVEPGLRSRLAATVSTFRSRITAPTAGEPFLPRLHRYPFRG